MHRAEHLTIESTSASKPSLLSSFWSLNVQVQNNEKLDLDVKCCSQLSLPEATVEMVPKLRPTRSMTEITVENCEHEKVSNNDNESKELPSTEKEPATNRVANWIQGIESTK